MTERSRASRAQIAQERLFQQVYSRAHRCREVSWVRARLNSSTVFSIHSRAELDELQVELNSCMGLLRMGVRRQLGESFDDAV